MYLFDVQALTWKRLRKRSASSCEDRQLFPARLYQRQRHRATHLSIISIFPHTLSLLSSILHLYHVFQNHSGCLLDHALTSHADSNVILLTYALSLHLLLHLFLSPWLSGIVSQLSTKQTSFQLFLYNPHSASWA